MYQIVVKKTIVASEPQIENDLIPMSGKLSLKNGDKPFLFVEIPQDLLDGVFKSIKEEGIEKPENKAHISVMFGDEINKIDKIEEVGKDIEFFMGPLKSVDPEGWDEMEKVWFITCFSPELLELRQKYNLTPKPNGDHDFHITVAVKPKEQEMKFSSTEEAVQYLSDLTQKRIVIANKPDVETEILKFLKDNPNPTDSEIHKLAEKLGVDTDDFESSMYKLSTGFAMFLNNGRANEKGITEKDVDPKELAMGIEVEKEHTTDIATAKRIALDHLSEISDYYTRLKKMEEDAGIKE